ncbi:MAG: Nif3-like dinuclear metal center hexameric protein [Deltaproteobacteria bacterium]|nr:Nif3-like dinuclear metal center hexameric protein [Deltaproteobacteria bacterium]
MDAKAIDIVDIMNQIAPSALAEEKDNVGLQCGYPDQTVEKVRVALDPTMQVVNEACQDHIDILITHHPLIFKPLRTVDFSRGVGSIIQQAAMNNMSLFSAHTNLDSVEGGINDILAGRIGLKDTAVLGMPYSNDVYKLAVFVPVEYSQKILDVLFKADAGRFGNYSCCSFSSEGIGTFMPEVGAKPFSGRINEVNQEKETKIEALVLKKNISATVKLLKENHPYETMAYDVYPVVSEMGRQGLGRVGILDEEVSLDVFAEGIREKMKLATVKIAGRSDLTVKKVAVCSGSGSSLMNEFLFSGAQVYVSGDLKYHDARIAEESERGLIDIGHFGSEHIIVEALAERIREELGKRSFNVKVDTCRSEKDPFTVII